MLQLTLTLIVVQVAILILLRPLILWYLKLNQIAKLLASIDESLKFLPAVRERRAVKPEVTRRVA